MDPVPPNIPPAMLEHLRKQHRSKQIEDAVEPLREEGSDKIERELLCDLWRDLGDLTESYWQAMCTATAFTKIDRFIHTQMEQLSEAPRLRVMEAVARTLLMKVDLQRAISAKRQEIINANPLPGDHA